MPDTVLHTGIDKAPIRQTWFPILFPVREEKNYSQVLETKMMKNNAP
jgi:hypothetical protein